MSRKRVNMGIKTLDEKIEELSNSSDFEDKQLHNWLSQLKEYFDRDTPMEVINMNLSGECVCPKCNNHMKLGVRSGFCNECGQAIYCEE